MSNLDKEKVIRNLFAAYLTDNREAVEDVFAADFRFTSPYDDRIDKRTYFERCWRSSNWIERHVQVAQYWDFNYPVADHAPRRSDADYAAELRHEFEEAVRLRLRRWRSGPAAITARPSTIPR